MNDAVTLPPPTALSSLPPAAQAAVLDTLFEPSPALHRLCLPLPLPTSSSSSSSPPSYPALVAAIAARLHALLAAGAPADVATLDDVLRAHPRLGEPREAAQSALSKMEQASLGGGATGAGGAGGGADAQKDAEGPAADAQAAAGSGESGEQQAKGPGHGSGDSNANADANASANDDDDLAAIRRLNVQYEAVFGGLKFVCVLTPPPVLLSANSFSLSPPHQHLYLP